ncbi:hypothetical protein TNCT_68261 [Trichonephila clavata]|uniref:Uncharacterized protein n=1 Tax=Trichonephila clavata TaxID=2740835 RepID=A0A8X6KNF4_TRICU|nr:hypothetical protein TNCT_68261 [Trichonephila clavata]
MHSTKGGIFKIKKLSGVTLKEECKNHLKILSSKYSQQLNLSHLVSYGECRVDCYLAISREDKVSRYTTLLGDACIEITYYWLQQHGKWMGGVSQVVV